MLTCTKCRIEQDCDEFRKDPRKSNGKRSVCKTCDRAYARDYQRRTGQYARWKNENPQRWTAIQRGHMLRRYGITVEDYERMLAEQGDACAICRTTTPRTGRGRWRMNEWGQVFTIDHCHKTGPVRGLLCMTCNVAIGGMADNPALLVAAIAYLLGAPFFDLDNAEAADESQLPQRLERLREIVTAVNSPRIG